MAWAAADMPSQTGRVAVVTGATSGIGLHTARALARAGAEVVLAVRDGSRGERVRADIGAAAVVRLDLAEQASVREAAAALLAGWPRIDLLVNNAGVMALPRRTTADGFELQMARRARGHGLQRRAPGRSHDRPAQRTPVSALAGVLADQARQPAVHVELGRRAAAAGLGLVSVAAHPGLAKTNLQAAGPRMDGSRLRELLIVRGTHLIGQSDAQGALPSLYAATMPDLPSGTYVGPDGIFEGRGRPKLVSASKAAQDEAQARRLWEVSEKLTGVPYL